MKFNGPSACDMFRGVRFARLKLKTLYVAKVRQDTFGEESLRITKRVDRLSVFSVDAKKQVEECPPARYRLRNQRVSRDFAELPDIALLKRIICVWKLVQRSEGDRGLDRHPEFLAAAAIS